MLKAGFSAVLVERGAGASADLPDASFAAAGATLVDSADLALAADVVLKVRPPSLQEASMLKEGAALVSHIQPARNAELLEALQRKRATVVAMDCIPRQLSRAQTFDSLSSMANIAGYR
jgi:H+-translocating NAD(P) transhydrogenase